MDPYSYFGGVEQQQESLPQTYDNIIEEESDSDIHTFSYDALENEVRDFLFSSTMSGTGGHQAGGDTTTIDDTTQESSALLSYGSKQILIVVLLVCLIVLLVLTLLYLVVPPFMVWMRRPKPEDDDKRTERRYETIEGWLISKRVRAHDDECVKLRVAFCKPCAKDQPEDATSPKSVEIQSPSSFDSADTVNTGCSSGDEESGEGDKECPICMEPFAVDDIVSWSPNVDATCRHVFHHECIKEWMLQSGNCPCCRELILPIDEEGFSLERPALKELCRKRARLAATSYYCHVDGFICFEAPSVKCTRKSIEMLKKATSCRITPKDLVERRGHRTGAATEDGDEDLSSVSDSGHEEEPDNRQPTGPQQNSTANNLTLSLGEDQQLASGQTIQSLMTQQPESDNR